MKMPKAMAEWLKEHAELRDGKFVCKKTGEEIKSTVVGRSLWIRPFTGGSGEVARVLHVACTACNPTATPPDYGTPIYDDELVESGARMIA